MRRALVAALAGAAIATTVAATAPSAGAASPGLDTAYAAAAKVTPGSGTVPAVTTSGSIGALLGFVTPVLAQVVNPLVTQLSGLSATMVADLASLTGVTSTATSGGTPQSPPASGYPLCGTPGWTIGNCYGPTVPAVTAAPIITLGTGTVQGYATADSTGGYSRARTSNLALSLLGVNVGNLGVSDSSAKCNAVNVCTSASTLAGMSLLGGAVSVQTANDGTLQVSINNGPFINATALSTTTVSAPGVASATVQSDGKLIRLNIGLTLHDLLGALSIVDTLSSLNAVDAGSVVTLSLTVGTGTTVDDKSSGARGMQLTVGLGVDAKISVLGLVTIEVVSADNPDGNLVGLQLAYTSAVNADPTAVKYVPPALI